MVVLLIGMGLFALSFLAQVALKYVWRPRGHSQAVLGLYAAVPLLALSIAWAAGHPLALSVAECVRLGLFYVAFMLAYVVLYSAVEERSPTLAIVSRVAHAGAEGCTDDELFALFAGQTLSGRFALMELGGWLQRDHDVITLTRHGRFLGTLFDRASRIFGLTKGG